MITTRAPDMTELIKNQIYVMLLGNISDAVDDGTDKTGKSTICKTPFLISLFLFTSSSFSSSNTISYDQAKLLCPKFARAGASGVSLVTGIGLTLVVGMLAALGAAWRRKHEAGVDWQGGGDEAVELHSCELKREGNECI